MAWNNVGLIISMAEGDYGIELPITFSDVTLTNADSMKLTIKAAANDEEPLIEKEFTNISENTINLKLTAEESALLPVGTYVYVLDWYQDGEFLCNVIPNAALKVVDKA